MVNKFCPRLRRAFSISKSKNLGLAARGLKQAIAFRLVSSGKEWSRSLVEKYVQNRKVIMEGGDD
jgi:hypothetical protein